MSRYATPSPCSARAPWAIHAASSAALFAWCHTVGPWAERTATSRLGMRSRFFSISEFATATTRGADR